MKKMILFMLVVFLYADTGCQVKGISFPNESNQVWGNYSHGLRISMDISEPRFKIGQPAIAIVFIENGTSEKINVVSIPVFTFNNLQYWCPVDIVNEGSSLPANARVILTMDGHSIIKTRLDISKLKCGQGSSSIWPESTFYALLPFGEYSLRLDMEIIGGGDNAWIRSNEVSVEISN
jgi:hypothetical protein